VTGDGGSTPGPIFDCPKPEGLFEDPLDCGGMSAIISPYSHTQIDGIA